MNNLIEIASKFAVAGNIISVEPLGDGFINDTFFVQTKDSYSPNYILQKKNKNIFTDIPAMMDNIRRVTLHLKKKIITNGGNPFREVLTVIPTEKNVFYFKDQNNDFWAMCIFINDTVTHQKAENKDVAFNAGKGLGKFQKLLADFDEPLADILPGFHNMKIRFQQWDNAIANDIAGRVHSVKNEIDFIEKHRAEMLSFRELVDNGSIPARVVHNDTKINNFLFNHNNEIECVIDLDTVMKGTCLNDFGDAIRSLTNTGLEDDPNLDNVSMNKMLFDSYKSGYLSEAEEFLTDIEKQYLDFSAKYITFEQVLRFLMDYINGDSYYKIKYPEHNLVRTRAQRKLFETM